MLLLAFNLSFPHPMRLVAPSAVFSPVPYAVLSRRRRPGTGEEHPPLLADPPWRQSVLPRVATRERTETTNPWRIRFRIPMGQESVMLAENPRTFVGSVGTMAFVRPLLAAARPYRVGHLASKAYANA